MTRRLPAAVQPVPSRGRRSDGLWDGRADRVPRDEDDSAR